MTRPKPTYLSHLVANWTVAYRCFRLGLVHLIHGLLPFPWTHRHRYLD